MTTRYAELKAAYDAARKESLAEAARDCERGEGSDAQEERRAELKRSLDAEEERCQRALGALMMQHKAVLDGVDTFGPMAQAVRAGLVKGGYSEEEATNAINSALQDGVLVTDGVGTLRRPD